MPLIQSRQPWTRQPTVDTRVNWANPLTRGLEWCVTREGKRDLVTGTPPVSVEGFPYTNAGTTGLGRRYLNTNFDYDSWATPTKMIVDGANATILCIYKLHSVGLLQRILSLHFAASTYGMTISPTSTTGRLIGINVTTPGNQIVTRTGNLVSGETYFDIGRVTGESLRYFSAVFGEKFEYYSTTLVGGLKMIGATGAIRIASDDLGSNNASATVFLAAVWSRSLSDIEISSIYANPWQLFI